MSEVDKADKIVIKREIEVPKGEYCDWCQAQSSQFHPYFNPWNDELTRYESYGWCQFFNERLTTEETDCPCCTRNKKCFACLIATNKDLKIGASLFLLSMLSKQYEMAETDEQKTSLKKIASEIVESVPLNGDK